MTRRLTSRRAMRWQASCLGLALAASAAFGLAATAQRPRIAPPAHWRDTVAPIVIIDAGRAAWSTSSHFSGGRVRHDTSTTGGTGSPQLYAYYREGVARYTRNVPRSGTYAIDLFFQDPWAARPGERVFDVVVNGRTVARHFDVNLTAGRDQAAHLLLMVPITHGRLDVRFRSVRGRPLVSAIEGTFMSLRTSSRLLWADDFSGPAGAAPGVAWNHETGSHPGELEYYTRSTANSHLDGRGHLAIVARRARIKDASGATYRYSSARITTKRSFASTFGLVTARMRLPLGTGLWPAFWGVGTDIDKVGWPQSGEIDVIETPGKLMRESAWMHFPVRGADARVGGVSSIRHTAAGFVDYSVLRTPIGLQVFIAGVPFVGISPADMPRRGDWVFNQPYFLVLNLAVGTSKSVGYPNAGTRFPATMLVDSVRAYG